MRRLLLISILFTTAIFAEFKVGDTLPSITLEDQFEKKQTIKSSDKMIIMAFEKDISIAIADYLKSKPATFLADNHTKYISDISSMPSLITSMFALPKMRKYPFSVMLIDDNFGEQFSHQEGTITIINIKSNKITKISFIDSSKIGEIF
jgi:hypothetical protein